jgi:glycosyltransferase involved in cell wall biosynthesis
VIRILYTIPNFITAGSGAALLHIIRRLDRSRFAPAVCVSRRGGSLEREVEALGIPLLEAPFTVPARPLMTLPWRVWQAARAFRTHRFDIWHSFHYLDDYSEPLIAYAAGTRAWIYNKKNMSWRGRAWKIRSRLAKAIAAQNTAMLREFLADPRYLRKTRLIPPGVDTERFRPGLEPKLGLRARLGIGPDVPVAVAVGHLLPVKGHDLLLRAAAGVEELHVWIAGAPQDREWAARLEELRRELGLHERVQFLGAVSDIGALHAEADFFVHPTRREGRQEGCPVALLEAMACGKAPVATKIAGVEDVIEDGVSGVLTAAGDVEAMRAAMARLMRDAESRKQLGEAARQRILSHYAIELEVRRHEEMYERVLGRR